MLGPNIINQPIGERLLPIRRRVDKNKLLIHEIYASIQGETSHMGKPCVLVRTTGCHLRCSYCDTEHAFFSGSEMNVDEIVKTVSSFGINLVLVTGGEPLLQKPVLLLFDRLLFFGFTVLLETSGAVSIEKIPKQVKVILDVKTPSSGESEKNLFKNLDNLWPECEVKFVMSNHEDYVFAKEICRRYQLFERTHVLFSPVILNLDPKRLIEWILEDKLPIRFQLQLHRVIYGDEPGR